MDSKLKLLLLEDNPADAGLIQKLLERSEIHFSATVAGNAKEFLKALDDDKYDVVLADNALPQYSSIEALEVIKAKNPFIAFILVTGTVSEEFAVSIIQQGADDYILKTNLIRLPAAIRKAAENKKIQKEKYYAEKEMRDLNEQLRQLASHLQNIREEEQTRIAREIHDELGQMLTTIRMDITAANKKMEESVSNAKSYLTSALEIIDNTVRVVRKIASELRPSILDDLGLVAALECQSMEFEKHNNIKCSFSSSVSDISIENNVAIVFYRIYQEALTNIARHAEATGVTCRLTLNNGQLTLLVTDNGKGFNPEAAKAKRHFGLVGMKERALMVKGKLEIESLPGKGTTIMVNVPFSRPGSRKES